MNIICLGPMWRGSNAGGLFRAMSRAGARIEVIDEFYYISLNSNTLLTKIISSIVRSFQIRDYNKIIVKSVLLFRPDILFVYKGAFILPKTLQKVKNEGIKLVNFYPDVSMFSHGKLLPKTMPLYETIFTTKTFGIKDLLEKMNIRNSFFIPHGFDPEIHRPLQISMDDLKRFSCDVSFIGTWSPKKERLLSYVLNKLPNIDLKIWGNQWDRCNSTELLNSIRHAAVVGDLYALAIQSSKINLGILSEKVIGASDGDRITSRTFHIPACGGFMLHERNSESVTYFKENEEATFFEDDSELVAKIDYFLNHDDQRLEISKMGHQRCLNDHSLDNRAMIVLKHLTTKAQYIQQIDS